MNNKLAETNYDIGETKVVEITGVETDTEKTTAGGVDAAKIATGNNANGNMTAAERDSGKTTVALDAGDPEKIGNFNNSCRIAAPLLKGRIPRSR